MKHPSLILALAAALASSPAFPAADKIVVTVTQSLDAARPGEVVTVPWRDVVQRMPGARPEKLVVRDA